MAIARDSLHIHEVPEDGNCQIHAWEAACKATSVATKPVNQLVQQAAHWIRDRQDEFDDLLRGASWYSKYAPQQGDVDWLMRMELV